jgi:hypothetical protein
MIKVYSAQNAFDAHIIKGMLAQQGIVARVDGEFLQGGIGELPLIDLVTVSVSEEDYEKALKALQEYEGSD